MPQVGAVGGDIFLGGVHRGLLQTHVGLGHPVGGELRIRILARYRAILHQQLITVPGDARQILLGHGVFQRGACLIELLFGLRHHGAGLQDLGIQIRRFDIGQQLPRVDAIADIHIAFADIAGGAGINIRLGQRRDIARQEQRGLGRRALDAGGLHDGNSLGLAFGGGARFLFAFVARDVADQEDQHHHQQGPGGNQRQAPGTQTGGAPAGRKHGAVRLRRQARAVGWHQVRSGGRPSCASSSITRSWSCGGSRRRNVYMTGQKQGGERGDEQAADDGAAERRILLAAFTQAERHRSHADDHGESGHANRPNPREARGTAASNCVFAVRALIVGENDQQNSVGSGHADAP